MLKFYQKKFLNSIHEKTFHIEGLELLAVYGSYIRDELTSKSDVDFFALFHDVESLKKGEGILYDILNTLSENELELPASLYAVCEDEDIDKSFLYGILTEGFLITPAISEYLVEIINPAPQVLFTYSMDGLAPQEKVKVSQILYGYSQRKKDKTYINEGMLPDIQGQRVRSGIMVPQKYENELERFMRSHKLNYQKKVVFA
jgi:predicted nucleotidyltransferase